MNEILAYMRFFFIFVAGMIIGRVTMAIQYAVMKPKKHSATTNTREDKKTVLSKEADKFYTPGATVSIIKPLNCVDLKNKF